MNTPTSGRIEFGRSRDTGLIHLAMTVLTLGAAATAIVPGFEDWYGAAIGTLIAAGVLTLAVKLVRRELRIRRRLAAIRNEPVPGTAQTRRRGPDAQVWEDAA
ncbi:hypothetical protein GCM10009836_59560 [Pseudonocardia ailaonensis]|uniref:UsfY protein n=1 Tax=Pseudonocardia ailaonensis TaxID=367279 RepID=A0ABN2NIN4_9PSEU